MTMSTSIYEATGAARQAVREHLPTLIDARVATRIFAKDYTLWGPEAEAESAVRLGWVDAPTASRSLVEDLLELRAALHAEGVTRVVLCGMGGSSLAPEVIARTAGVELTVLDSTDPDHIRAVLSDRLTETAVVISSKSGTTVETDSHLRAFAHAFEESGLNAPSRIIVVTDPDSPLDRASRQAGYRAIFHADPHVGGRFSALTAFGLVPSALAGVDIRALLDEAEEAARILNDDSTHNGGLILGAVLGGTRPLRDKIVIVEEGSGIVGFADWAEQLVAESTGKLGTGLLPVVAGTSSPETVSGADDVLVVRLVAENGTVELRENEVSLAGGLATQIMMWELATAVAGRLLGINPFDQPDVEAAKVAARNVLREQPERTPAAFVDGAIEVRGGEWLGAAATSRDAVVAFLSTLQPKSYLSIHAYVDRLALARLEDIRHELAALTARPVTFGWGPRFLHSTGQFHKGGPAIGIYLQITATAAEDLAIPGRPFTFGELIAAQAEGDAQVLDAHGHVVLRLHLTDRELGVAQLEDALSSLRNTATVAR